jgi:hypothetical protein
MRPWLLIPLALPLVAAAPQPNKFSLGMPAVGGPLLPVGPQASLSTPARGPVYEPAPLPNRDVSAPSAARNSNEPTLAPTLFTTKNQYRGDGFAPNSTAQTEQEKRVKPGAGFSLHMPLTPQ